MLLPKENTLRSLRDFCSMIVRSVVLIFGVMFSGCINESTETYTIQIDSDCSQVHYTVDGSKPDSTSLRYTGPIEQLFPQELHALSKLESYVCKDSSWLTASWFRDHPYNTETPDIELVKRQAIVQIWNACAEDSFQFMTYPNYQPEEWEVKLFLDQPEQLFDIDSGIYVSGVGLTVNDSADNELFTLPNYAVAENSTLLNLVDSDLKKSLPVHWLKGAKCIVQFTFNDSLVHQSAGRVRVNGGFSSNRPLKGLKIKLKTASSEIPFAETGNLYLKRSSSSDIGDILSNSVANDLAGFAPKITKDGVFAHVLIQGAECLESFGIYTAQQSNDKQFAREYLGFERGLKKFDVQDPNTGFGHITEENFDTLETMNYARILRDTSSLFQLPYESLDSLVNVEAWIEFLLINSMFRGMDVWNNNMTFFAQNGTNMTPVFKDGDGMLDRFFFVNGTQDSSFNHNFLDDFLNGRPSFYNQSRDNLPTWICRAILYHPEKSSYNQNLMLDLLNIGFPQFKMDSVAVVLGNQWLDLINEHSAIERINGDLDTTWYRQLLDRNRFFVRNMKQEFLSDFIEIFHKGYSIKDVFRINVQLAEASEDARGSVKINSLQFHENGTRLHLRDFPIMIEAIARDGFAFSSWEEFPDSDGSFVLRNSDVVDLNLTPVFVPVSE